MNVVRLAKKRYVIGLWWQVQQAALDMKRQARTLNQELGTPYTHLVVRPSQMGMGKAKRLWRGLPSLASTLAQAGDSRLLVCHFADISCWWVCALKEGCIAAEGDWIGASEPEAVAHAEHLRHMLDLPEALILRDKAPLQALVDAACSSNTQFFSGLSAQNRLQSLASSLRPMLIFASTIAVLMTLFLAYSAGIFSDNSMTDLHLEQRRMDILNNPMRFFSRPWLEAPPVNAWSKRCTKLLLQTPFTDKGWDLREATCTGNSVELQWEFSQAASFLHLPEGAELLTPTTARKKLPLEALPAGLSVDLASRDQVARKLYELARLLGLHLTITWKDKAQRVITEGSLSVPVVAPWHEGTFSVENVPSMIILDKDLYEALHTIPGLVLQSVSYLGGTWKIKGLCHGT